MLMDSEKPKYNPREIYPEVKVKQSELAGRDLNLTDQDRHNSKIIEDFKATRAAKIANEDLTAARLAILFIAIGILVPFISLLAGFFAVKAFKQGQKFELETGAKSKSKNIAEIVLILAIISVGWGLISYYSSGFNELKLITPGYRF